MSEKGNTLDRMGFVHGTDKSSLMSSRSWAYSAHDYLRHYDFLFHPFREDTFSLVEFGCQKGNSLRMWEEYFPNAELFWDMVSPGGFYVIEDLECGTLGAYPAFPPSVQDSQPFSGYMRDRCEYLRWAPGRLQEENSYHFGHLPEHVQNIERSMDMCVFIPGAVIVRKRG